MIVPSEDQAHGIVTLARFCGQGVQQRWLDQALDYILGPNGTPLKRNKLARYLQKRASQRPSGITVKEIEQLPLPALPPIEGFRFNYSLSDLLRIAEKYTHNSPRDVNRVVRYAIIMCGIRIGDTRSLASVHLDSGYALGKRFPRVTGSVHSKRLSMRVVPNQAWGGQDRPIGPFSSLRLTHAEGS